MAAIIKDEFKIITLQKIIASTTTDSVYLGIGRPYSWDTISNSDAIIPLPLNTIVNSSDDWSDMLQMKRITFTDAISGFFKEMWQPNVIYDRYRHDWNGSRAASYTGANSSVSMPTSISDVKCTVITSNYSIYVCLRQNVINGIIQPSIYSPDTGSAVGTNTGIVVTADGYYWKFIAVTSSADLIKFSSKYYHPIETIPVAPAPSDPYYTQWVTQLNSTSFKGGIYSMSVLTAGSGYNSGIAGTRNATDAENDAQFQVVGDGIGLQCTVTYGAAGSISDVVITNPGSGYTYATVTAIGGIGASFDLIFTPMRGLGVDPVRDVVARYLLVNTTLTGAEGGIFTTSNDYRKISLIFNPYNFGTSSIATAADLDATQTLFVGTGLSSGAYPIDAIITGSTSGCKARVVDFVTSTGALRLIRTSSENSNSKFANNSFMVGEGVATSSGTGGGIISSISNPNVKSYSGDIVYTEYRAPVLRNISQTETLNIILKF